MSDINKMDFKQLRNEVQLLRDELAIMKRKYEDMLYNLDTDNFSSRFIKEQGDMRTAIEVTADGIKSMVSKEEFQTAMEQTAEEIRLSASALDEEISSLSVTTSGIRSKVNRIEDGEFNGYTLFEQTSDKFSFTGNVEVISEDEYSNTLELSSGHIQLYPNGYSSPIVDLGMHYINANWEPRMQFGRGTGDGYTGIGWIYKTTNGFGMMYNNGSSIPPTIEFQNDGIYILGDVTFSDGTVTGVGGGGTGGTVVAVFG